MAITKSKKLSNKDRKKAFLMKQKGFKQFQIAEYFKKTKGAISKLFKNKEKFERMFETTFVNFIAIRFIAIAYEKMFRFLKFVLV